MPLPAATFLHPNRFTHTATPALHHREHTPGISRKQLAGLGLETIRPGDGVRQRHSLFRQPLPTTQLTRGESARLEAHQFTHNLASEEAGSQAEQPGRLPTTLGAQNSLVTTRLERHGSSSSGLSNWLLRDCLLYTSPSPRDQRGSRMPSSA